MCDVERSREADRTLAGSTVREGLAPSQTECPTEPAATAAAAGSTASQAIRSLSADPDDLEFELACSVIYHRAREAWFTTLRRGTMFATILLGTASVAPVVPTVLTGPLVAMMGALNLAFDFAGQSSRHADLRASFLEIATNLHAAGFSAQACTDARRSMLKLAAKEPPTYCTVALAARNQSILSLGRDRRDIERISWKRSWTRHIWRAEGV